MNLPSVAVGWPLIERLNATDGPDLNVGGPTFGGIDGTSGTLD
jgi:hypothetical protein